MLKDLCLHTHQPGQGSPRNGEDDDVGGGNFPYFKPIIRIENISMYYDVVLAHKPNILLAIV